MAMNEEYVNLMAEAKDKDEKAYQILEKPRNHPLYAYILPDFENTRNGFKVLLFVPVVMRIAELFERYISNSFFVVFLLVALAMEIIGIKMTSFYCRTVRARKNQAEAESEEQLPILFLYLGIGVSILYFLTYAIRFFIHPAFLVNGNFVAVAGSTSFLSILSAMSMYLLIIWGYCKDLSAITFPKEDYEYLNHYFKDNAEKDSMDNIIGRYYSDEEGVVYYRKGNHISLSLPAGTLPPKFENTFKAELLKENKEVSNNE